MLKINPIFNIRFNNTQKINLQNKSPKINFSGDYKDSFEASNKNKTAISQDYLKTFELKALLKANEVYSKANEYKDYFKKAYFNKNVKKKEKIKIVNQDDIGIVFRKENYNEKVPCLQGVIKNNKIVKVQEWLKSNNNKLNYIEYKFDENENLTSYQKGEQGYTKNPLDEIMEFYSDGKIRIFAKNFIRFNNKKILQKIKKIMIFNKKDTPVAYIEEYAKHKDGTKTAQKIVYFGKDGKTEEANIAIRYEQKPV